MKYTTITSMGKTSIFVNMTIMYYTHFLTYVNFFQFNLNHKEKSEYLLFILKTFDYKLCKQINKFKDIILNKDIYKVLTANFHHWAQDIKEKKNVKKILPLMNHYYKQNKNEITLFLTEIYDLYQGLMKSSSDIDRIFQIPLRLIKAKQVSINIY